MGEDETSNFFGVPSSPIQQNKLFTSKAGRAAISRVLQNAHRVVGLGQGEVREPVTPPVSIWGRMSINPFPGISSHTQRLDHARDRLSSDFEYGRNLGGVVNPESKMSRGLR